MDSDSGRTSGNRCGAGDEERAGVTRAARSRPHSPRTRAPQGMVEKDGAKIPLDDPEIFQTLCARRNREKQDRRSVGCRPSADRLRESLTLIAERSEAERPSALTRPKTSG